MKEEQALLLGLGALGLFALLKPKPPALAGFAGFRTEVREGPTQTTTRQSDGVQAYDFWHYPLVDVTADVDGQFQFVWSYKNYVDGGLVYQSGDIVNLFDLLSGQVTRLELVDNRPENQRGGSIGYGDPDGFFDGVWHAFRSEVSVTVISPSGAQASASGVLQESFMTFGALSVAFVGFNVQTIP